MMKYQTLTDQEQERLESIIRVHGSDMLVQELAGQMPREILLYIYDFYEGLLVSSALKIQHAFAAYKGWRCDDCGQPHIFSNLRSAHACSDEWGCCYKLVCPTACAYFCQNGHENYDRCHQYFEESINPSFYCGYEKQCRLCPSKVNCVNLSI